METRLTTLTPLELLERDKRDEARERFGELDGLDRDLAEGCYYATIDPERAKDFLSRVVAGTSDERRNKALIWLGCAYWRIGERQEGIAFLDSAEPETDDVWFVWGFTRSTLEAHNKKAMSFLKKPGRMVDRIDNPLWLGKFYHQRAFLYCKLKKPDKAIIDYIAAMYWYEQNDEPQKTVAMVKNNLAGIYRDAKDFELAHKYVDEAISVLTEALKAQAYDQKATIYIAERKYNEAEPCALKSVAVLERTDQKQLLGDSLITLAQAAAGLRRFTDASLLLDRAESVGEYLNNHDLLISVLQGRVKTALIVENVCRRDSVRMAIETTSSARSAADKLGVSHAAVIQFLANQKTK